MPSKITPEIQNIINTKNISTGVEIRIYDLDNNLIDPIYYENLIEEYSYSLSKKFSASSASITFNNTNGIFSPDNEDSIIKTGFKVQIKEFFNQEPTKLFERFYGLIRQINPTKTGNGNAVEVVCYDLLIKLQETDIEKVFESNFKEFVETDVLEPNPLPEPREYLSQIYDGNYSAWAPLPPPSISIVEKNSNFVATTQTDGFEVLYQSGQIRLNTAINIEDFDVKAKYYYYKKGLYAEDIIKGILLEPDDTGNPLFSQENITSTLLEEDNISQDKLLPYTKPLNLIAKLERKFLISDNEIFISRNDSWKFITSHKLKIGGTELTWNGKEDVVINGVELTKLKNISGTHSEDIFRGQTVSLYYEPDTSGNTQVWHTTYNNIIDTVIPSDFIVPGASFETFDTRTGFLLIDTKIPSSSEVILDKNYDFLTLQASGIEIPYLRLSKKTHSSRMEAIKREVLGKLPPNYILLSRGKDKIWGLYLSQKPNSKEDYELKLNQKLQYISDQETYTRVFLVGKNNNPHNVMLDDDTKVLSLDKYDIPVESLATDQPLRLPQYSTIIEFRGGYFPFSIYRFGSADNDKMLIYSQWEEDGIIRTPTIKIDDTPVADEINRKSRIPVSVRDKKVYLPNNIVVPPHDEETSIIFYDHDGNILAGPGGTYPYVITKSNTEQLNVNAFDIIYVNNWYPEGRRIATWVQKEDHSVIENWAMADFWVNFIGFVSYSVLLPERINGSPSYRFSQGWFLVHRDILNIKEYLDPNEIPDGVDYVKTNLVKSIKQGNSWVGKTVYFACFSKITGSFKFRSVIGKFDEPFNLKDGDPNTEAQLSFFGETAISGQTAFIIDLGAVKKIQALDIIAGKFYPFKEYDKGFALDCEFGLTLQSADSPGVTKITSDVGVGTTTICVNDTDDFPDSGYAFIGDDQFFYTSKSKYRFFGVSGITKHHYSRVIYDYDPETGARIYRYSSELVTKERFANISQELSGINLKSGDSIAFDKSQLGDDFRCRLIRIVAEWVEPIEYARRVIAYPISIASFNVYEDVELEANARLSPTTKLSSTVNPGDNTILVQDTSLFPESGSAYIGTDEFSYSSKTINSFNGVSAITTSHLIGAYVTKENVWSSQGLFLLDSNNLLKKIGDKVFKEQGIQQKLTTQENLNIRAKGLLAEFYKNHHKIKIDNVFAPYVYVGQTARIIDPYSPSFEINRNYFIESVSCRNSDYSLELGFYP